MSYALLLLAAVAAVAAVAAFDPGVRAAFRSEKVHFAEFWRILRR